MKEEYAIRMDCFFSKEDRKKASDVINLPNSDKIIENLCTAL